MTTSVAIITVIRMTLQLLKIVGYLKATRWKKATIFLIIALVKTTSLLT